jgi:hypothetical protein
LQLGKLLIKPSVVSLLATPFIRAKQLTNEKTAIVAVELNIDSTHIRDLDAQLRAPRLSRGEHVGIRSHPDRTRYYRGQPWLSIALVPTVRTNVNHARYTYTITAFLKLYTM